MNSAQPYVVLCFDLDADDGFQNRMCRTFAALIDAMRYGIDALTTRGAVMILRRHADRRKTLDVVAACGAAENRLVALYAASDYEAGRWPRPMLQGPRSAPAAPMTGS